MTAALAAFHVLAHATDAQRRHRAATVLERQLGRLTRLLDDLIEMERLRSRNSVLHWQLIDLRGLTAEAADSVEFEVDQKCQCLETHLPAQEVWIDGDRGRLQQVLSNLLTNAIRYTDREGRVSLTLASTGEKALLTVSDTGRGIEAALLPHLFEPLTKGDATDAGLGLGLAIARQIVELHDGHIAASSAGAGCGAEFVVTLPTWRGEPRHGQRRMAKAALSGHAK